ncbi:hypothetical protein CHH83_05895 [Bacillus sp. 7586-K]|nr:hypothetical protein CHH83_05895 [Bacillus sp. 7586-K]
MPKLRDYFFSDLDIFFNTDEFSEKVDIDGKEIEVIQDNEFLRKQNLRIGEGLARGELLFVAKKVDFDERPFVEKIMKFNKKRYRILDISEDEHTYTITLAGFRS